MVDIQLGSQFFLYLLVGVITTVLLWKWLLRNRTDSRRLLPPSPPAFPVIGHLHLLLPIPHQALHKLSVSYGSLIHLYLGSIPCVVVSSPETAKEFLKTHESSFLNRPNSVAVDFLTYGSQDFSFAPYGPYWKFMKKLCMSELLGGRTLDVLYPVRREEMNYFIEFLLQKAKASEEINVEAELIRLTNNVVSRMLMSTRCSETSDEASAKTRLLVNVWAIGRDPNHWENPLEFHPERFLGGGIKSQMDVRGQHFEFLPFGSGRRGCPGTSLALQVVQTSLATMIQCFEWKLGNNKVQKNGKVDMEEGLGITLPRANPLVCVPVVRLNPFPAI